MLWDRIQLGEVIHEGNQTAQAGMYGVDETDSQMYAIYVTVSNTNEYASH